MTELDYIQQRSIYTDLISKYESLNNIQCNNEFKKLFGKEELEKLAINELYKALNYRKVLNPQNANLCIENALNFLFIIKYQEEITANGESAKTDIKELNIDYSK